MKACVLDPSQGRNPRSPGRGRAGLAPESSASRSRACASAASSTSSWRSDDPVEARFAVGADFACWKSVDRVVRDRASRSRRERARRRSPSSRFPVRTTTGDAALGARARSAPSPCSVWHADAELPDGTARVVLPGGFSYGDYLRCGAIARFCARDGRRCARSRTRGGLVLGICNGFQILCEAGLLPGVLRPNRQLQFVCRDVTADASRARTSAVHRRAARRASELVIPVKHGEGSWYGDAELVAELEARGQIVLRYTEDVERRRRPTSPASRTRPATSSA